MSTSQGACRVIRCRRVLCPEGEQALDVLVADGHIAELAPYATLRGFAVDDFGGAVVMPGLIDAHCHINEPGRTHWEGFRSATCAAAAGGITLLVDMPLNSEPVTTNASAFDLKVRSAQPNLLVDAAFYGGVVPANAGDQQTLSELSRAGAVAFKCFLCDSGLEDFPAVERQHLAPAMAHLATLGKCLLAHAELFDVDQAPQGAGPPAAQHDRRSYAHYLASRPDDAELRALDLLAELCEETKCAVHVVHLSSALALPKLAAWRQRGLPITVETCPHYLTFSEDDVRDGDTRFKCAPPLRSAANREALWQGLAEGTIDFIATDHSPCPPDLKLPAGGKAPLEGDFHQAWGGIASLQLLLPASWTAAQQRGHSLPQLAAWLSTNPARCLGLAQRGAMAPGQRADLVVWHPHKTFVVRGSELEHRHPLTPYEGRELAGVVERTYLAGEPVFERGTGRSRFAAPPRGQALRLRRGHSEHYPGFARWQAQPSAHIDEQLADCCGAQSWREGMRAAVPFDSCAELFLASEECFDALAENDWREAFTAHPRIGDVASLAARFASTQHLATDEQAGATGAATEVLAELAAANRAYEEQFGHVFLICASGKTADDMLAALRRRQQHSARQELHIASEEQRKITFLRLEKLLLGEAPPE